MNYYTQSILLATILSLLLALNTSGCSGEGMVPPDADMGVMNGDMDIMVPDMGMMEDADVILPDMNVVVDAGNEDAGNMMNDAGTDMNVVVEDAGTLPDAFVETDMGTTVDAGPTFVETVVPAGDYYWTWFPGTTWTNTDAAVTFCESEGGYFVESTNNLFSDVTSWTVVNEFGTNTRTNVDAALDIMCQHSNLSACQSWCTNTFGCNVVAECMRPACTERFSYASDAMFMSTEFVNLFIKQNGSNLGTVSANPNIICLMPATDLGSFQDLPHAFSANFSN